jgi:hypothetical protein
MPMYPPDVQVQDEDDPEIEGWAKWGQLHSEKDEHLPDNAKPDTQNWAEKQMMFQEMKHQYYN